MSKKLIGVAVAIVGLAVSACGGRIIGGGAPSSGGGTYLLPSFDPDLALVANLPKDTIGEELPSEGLGQIKDAKWRAVLGGYTQMSRSQSLAFPPGTKITIRNLSKRITHTLDVVGEITGPPAHFPKNPNLPIGKHGKNGELGKGYASGPIRPGKSVTVTLVKSGIYLIGCAFHYHSGMHDVLVVGRKAKPGPQATPQGTSQPSSTPTARSSYDP
jgi:plastocyanin